MENKIEVIPPIPQNIDYAFICGECDECIENEKPIIAYKVIRRDKEYPSMTKIYICDTCQNNDYYSCNDCEKIIYSDDLTSVDNGNICNKCLKNYTECAVCGNFVHNDNSYYRECCDRNFCENCSCDCDENDSNEFSQRNPDTNSKKFQSITKNAKIITTNRIFSSEIECNYSDYDSQEKLYSTFHKELGISTDGSLSKKGVELQTPLLQGDKGEKFMFDLCKKLCDYDYNVDAKCGLHIHLDSKDYKDNSFAIKTLMQFYIVFEDVILAMLPKSRRTNNYCKALKTAFHLSEIQDTDGMDDLESLWYRQTDKNEIKQYKTYKHGSRYYGVNFHSLFANGHIEIRFHSGTIDSQKILHWINLHSTIMDKIVNSDVQYSFFVGAITTLSLSEKINKFFSLLSLPEKQKDYLIARIQKFNVGLLQSENEFIPSSEAITEIKSDNQTTICVE